MGGQVLPFLFLFVPALILLYSAVDIYFRNSEGVLHRLTALILLTCCLMFLGTYLAQVLPINTAPLAIQYVILLSAFLNLTVGLYFFQSSTKSAVTIHPVLYHFIPLVPLAGVFLLLSDIPWVKITLHLGPVWRTEEYSLGLNLLVFGMIIYTMSSILIYLGLASRRLKLKPWLVLERKRMKIFFLAAVAILIWITIAQLMLKPLERFNPYIQADIISLYSIFIYVLALRYAMFNSDFLAVVGGRYETLFNNAPIGIVIFDEEWRYVDVNPAYLRLIGIMDQHDRSWKNASYTDFIFVEDSVTEEQIRKAKLEREPLQMETRLTNRLLQTYDVDVQINFFEREGRMWSFVLVQDITTQKENEHKLIHMAYHDSLTGLANRRKFFEQLEEELQRIAGTKGMFAVLLIDLDQFKWINDTLGHSAGDELLRLIAERLLSVVPATSSVARMGGDKFVVLLPELHSVAEAEILASQLIEKISEPITIHNHLIQTTASIGISLAPRDGNDAETLSRNADAAMYSAKKEGRNRYLFFRAVQREVAEQEFKLLNGLRTALEKNEFTLHYQPLIELNTGSLLGVEVLLRWHSDELGSVLPANFIPLAEETGAIVPIGEWVLRTAIRQGKQWIEAGCPDLIVSVNVSARQLKDPQLVSRLADVLREHDFPAGNLCLEITESSAIDNLEQSLQVCHEIVRLGVSLALDDFGTGYSSLGMLSRFPFRLVKIDKSLIHEIETNRKAADIIRSIVRLARSLRMEVLAEGVEREEQLEMLWRLGFRNVQGYLYARPMPAVELNGLIGKEKKRMFSPFQISK